MHILFASQEVESLYQPNISMHILYASQEVESKYRKPHFVCASQEVESVYQPSSGDTRILYASGEVESEYAYFVCFPGSWVCAEDRALTPLPPLSHSLFLSLTLSFFSFHSLSLLWILFGPLRHRDSRQNCNGGTYTSHVPKKPK